MINVFACRINLLKELRESAARTSAPCGECHLQPGEVCDICGRRAVGESAPEEK